MTGRSTRKTTCKTCGVDLLEGLDSDWCGIPVRVDPEALTDRGREMAATLGRRVFNLRPRGGPRGKTTELDERRSNGRFTSISSLYAEHRCGQPLPTEPPKPPEDRGWPDVPWDDIPTSSPTRPPTPDAPQQEGTTRTMTSPFGQSRPPGDGVKNEDLEGKLLLVKVTEKRTGIATTAGTADAVVADVTDLSSGEEHPGNLLFGKVLFGQFEVGVTYLGSIGKGTASPGKSAPWLWTDATDPASVKTANDYLAWKAQQNPASPSTPPAAAPPAQGFTPPAAAPAAPPPWAAGQ